MIVTLIVIPAECVLIVCLSEALGVRNHVLDCVCVVDRTVTLRV